MAKSFALYIHKYPTNAITPMRKLCTIMVCKIPCVLRSTYMRSDLLNKLRANAAISDPRNPTQSAKSNNPNNTHITHGAELGDHMRTILSIISLLNGVC